MKELALTVFQVVAALAIFNVWIIRRHKPTGWRGGAAKSLREEFAVYGLPEWVMNAAGVLKLLCALGLIVGLWVPVLTRPAAFGLAALMLVAIGMHIKVGDPLKKSLPAATVLLLVLVVALA